MKWLNALGFAALRIAGLMAIIMAIAPGCGPRRERADTEPKPTSTDQPVSRPKPKRLARDVEPTHENAMGAPTNPGPTTPSPESVSGVDFEATRRKAESGDAAARTALGNYYATGQGGRIDLPEAVKWYRAAAEQGEVRAQVHLAAMYAEGRGAPRDESEAAKWFYQ